MAETLSYANPTEPDASRPRHPAVVTLLMLLGVIAFFAAGVMGLVYIDRVGAAAGGLMIAAAALFLTVVFGLLSRPRPKYLAGAILTFGAFLAVAVAALGIHRLTEQLEQRIIAGNPNAPGGVIVVYAESDLGKSLGTLQAAHLINGGAAFLAFCLMVYLSVQWFGHRPAG